MTRLARLLLLYCLAITVANGFFATSSKKSSLKHLSILANEPSSITLPTTEIISDGISLHTPRRISRRVSIAFLWDSLACTTMAATLPSFVQPAQAKTGVKPEKAFANLMAAREELGYAAKNYFPKQDTDGLREYLDVAAVNLNNYEANAQALLESKLLDTESKKAIGTIRRYGVGADVIIMYGGLKAEVNEEYPNFQEVTKYFLRTLDSLEEVISICRDNGL